MKFKVKNEITSISIGGIEYAVNNGMVDIPDEACGSLSGLGLEPLLDIKEPTPQPTEDDTPKTTKPKPQKTE